MPGGPYFRHISFHRGCEEELSQARDGTFRFRHSSSLIDGIKLVPSWPAPANVPKVDVGAPPSGQRGDVTRHRRRSMLNIDATVIGMKIPLT
jgi:hypothetical protein